MPGMDGWRFRELQKAHSKLWHIPVVVVSDAPVNEEYALVLEASGMLIKPFERAELLKMVTGAVDRTIQSRQIRQCDLLTHSVKYEA
jgi:DNA-binding response OmpR family regulator